MQISHSLNYLPLIIKTLTIFC
ncbi:CRISPR-associated DxTHG motif protein [Pediococcus pentosaceus]|nr:CRISPR-associated DxTHG motif protein [Pediococcus pentosaceus]